MHYLAPDRPRFYDRPHYYSHNGRFHAPLPCLDIVPFEDGYLICISLRHNTDSFMRRTIRGDIAFVSKLLADWTADPETAMLDYFAYSLATPLPLPPEPFKITIDAELPFSLGDLEL